MNYQKLLFIVTIIVLTSQINSQNFSADTHNKLLGNHKWNFQPNFHREQLLNNSTSYTSSDTISESWIRHYGPDSLAEVAAIAVDNSGNVYVTGWSYNPVTLRDYATIKYDPSGNELWVALYNGPGNGWDEAAVIAVDNSGNVYVTGRSVGSGFNHYDYATIKYSPAGEELWAARYNGDGNFWDEAAAIALDENGNVYITGSSFGLNNYWVYTTIMYDRNGFEQWTAHYDGLGYFDNFAADIALDLSENVYVTGTSASDFATIKYNPEGIEQWAARYNGPANADDEAKAIALDAIGNVYVGGWSTGVGTFSDYTVIKYTGAGIEQWISSYNGPGNSIDYAYAMAVDLQGNVYITGESFDPATNTDYATVKYNTSGEEQWVARYNGPANAWDAATAIAVDASGNVYVTGRSLDAYYDFATIRYNSEGNELWVARYNAPASFDNTATAITVDESGSVYVTGWSEVVYAGVEIGSVYTTIKYEQGPVSIEEKKQTLPVSFELKQNYPNPFNSTTNIEYSIASASGGGFVTLKVYDILGREVATLVNEEKTSGTYKITFSTGFFGDGSSLPSGVYFYTLKAGSLIQTNKFIILR